tara:strand:+ start:202 stop:480 length:279 start_codon:yes stop_codon:yes gene_type:complete
MIKTTKKDTIKLTKDKVTKPTENNVKEKVQLIKEKLAELFTNEDVELATVIFTVKSNEEPQVWRKGHFYDTATLLNKVLFAYKSKAVAELGL